jgi:hypothetical protein
MPDMPPDAVILGRYMSKLDGAARELSRTPPPEPVAVVIVTAADGRPIMHTTSGWENIDAVVAELKAAERGEQPRPLEVPDLLVGADGEFTLGPEAA